MMPLAEMFLEENKQPLVPIEYNTQRILTTELLAYEYGTDTKIISNNFNRNKDRYMEGKHYHCLTGNDLKAFRANHQIDELPSNLNKLYLWTEKGALLHAKSLNTEKAWEVYDKLVETYFRKREQLPTGGNLIALALIEADKMINNLQLENKQKDQLIGELKPKADYTDRILKSRGTVTVSAISKDYGMSAVSFNKLLHKLKVQYKQGDIWLLYKEHQAKGYTHSKTFDYIDNDGMPQTRMQTQWTQKGRLFLYELLKSNNILPMIERQDLSA